MKKCFMHVCLGVALSLIVNQALAIDLVGVYQQALTNDPAFQIAHSTWLSERENIAISRGALLPQFDVKAGFGRSLTSNRALATGYTRFYNNATTYSLTLDQQIFNYQSWVLLKNAKANAKNFAAQYAAASQKLMYDTAAAYFAVLQSRDILRYTLAEKRSLARQLEQTTQRYKVGLIAITAVYQAQASYDGVVSEGIAASNDLANKKEELREITGQHYPTFATLGSYLPLVKPRPANINQWVRFAKKQNYSLLAARYGLMAARDNIHAQSAARFPTLGAEGSVGYAHNNNAGDAGFSKTKTAMLGVSLDFPVLQGGAISARTRQAEYDYQTAASTLEQTERSTISQTRQAYLGVLASISKIKSDKQAIVSARSSLKATEAAYIVGTSTMVDVLNEQSKLYSTQKDYATAQYNYILETLALKQAAGTLKVSDLQQINSWLRHKRVVKKAVKKIIKKTIKSKIRKATVIERELLNINPRHYTIQVSASPNQHSVVDFLNAHNIHGKAFSFYTYKHGQKWYKLIVGNYPNRAQAKRAVAKLPVAVKHAKPWVRDFASVQREIRAGLK